MKAKQHLSYATEQRRVTKMSKGFAGLIEDGQSPATWTVTLTERDPAKRYLARRSKKLSEDLIDDDVVRNPVRVRFDVREGDEAEVERLYIGSKDLELPDESARVLDWRASICSLYYEADCGPATYLGPKGDELAVTLLLRRGLQIADAEVEEITDLDVLDGYSPDGVQASVTANVDEFLTKILESPAGSTLREIIGTIQREQHLIIREPRDRPLILQAVAGSGKSTIALHRLAQILYDLRRRQTPVGKVTVFGPNPILVKYISRLLPSLQEQEVTHQTFLLWAMSELYPKRRKGAVDLGTKPEVILRDRLDARRRGPAAAKGSFEFLDAMERYLAQTAERKLPRMDVRIGPSICCPKDLIWQWYRGSSDLPYEERLKHTAAQLDKWVRTEAAKLADQLEVAVAQFKEGVQHSFPRGVKQATHMRDADTLHRKIRSDLLQAVSAEVQGITSRWQMGNLRELYYNLITQAGTLAEFLQWPGEHIQQFCKVNSGVKRQRWDEGDVGAMMYLYTRAYGAPPEGRWSHVVVDEGQDWSPVCYAVIRHWVQDESVTVVGDLAQGISGGAGLRTWEELRGSVFGESSLQVREISRSYRLTKPTLQLGIAVLKNGGLPVSGGLDAIRDGAAPDLLKCAGQEEEEAVVAFARRHIGAQWSVAVITPDEESAKAWQAVLKQQGLPAQVIDKSERLEGAVTVTPVLLSKGLEFDYVAVVGAGPKAYPVGPEPAKRLYVAITRAKQQVLVTAQRKLSPLLPGGEADDEPESKAAEGAPRRRRKAPADGAEPKKRTRKTENATGRKSRAGVAAAAEWPGILAYLKEAGAEVADRRKRGGALWIIGGKELSPLVRRLKSRGWVFNFLPGGDRATGGRDAWFAEEQA